MILIQAQVQKTACLTQRLVYQNVIPLHNMYRAVIEDIHLSLHVHLLCDGLTCSTSPTQPIPIYKLTCCNGL